MGEENFKNALKTDIDLLTEAANKNNGLIHIANIGRGFNYWLLEHSGIIPETAKSHNDREKISSLISPQIHPIQYQRAYMNFVMPDNKEFYDKSLEAKFKIAAELFRADIYAKRELVLEMSSELEDPDLLKELDEIKNRPLPYWYIDIVQEMTDLYQLLHDYASAPDLITEPIREELKAHALKVLEHYPKIEWEPYRLKYLEILEQYKEPNFETKPLTRIKSRRTSLSTSKAAREQGQIALWGEGGGDVIIDKKKNISIEAVILPSGTELTCFERELQDAIGSLHQLSLNEVVKSKGEKDMNGWTLAQIYREFAGLTEKEKVNQRQEQQVKEAIEKMRAVEAEINFKSQATSHKNLKIKPDEAYLRGPLVAADYVFIRAGGRIKEGYRFTRAPLFYEYSKKIKQVATIDKELLNTNLNAITHKIEGNKKTRNNSDTFLLVKRWTLKQIEHIRSQKGFNEPRRSYQGLFEWLGINPTEKQARTIKADLDYYLEVLKARKEISGFTKYKAGKAYVGVEIHL